MNPATTTLLARQTVVRELAERFYTAVHSSKSNPTGIEICLAASFIIHEAAEHNITEINP